MIEILKFISRGIIRTVLYIILKIFYGMNAKGKENIPKGEPLIFCGNHKSFFDPIAIVLTAGRKMRFVAKEELKRNIFTRYVCWSFNCIYVKRDKKDIDAIKQCLKTLKEGGCLGIFPEGTRNGMQKNNGEIQNGAGYLALKTNVKIVPIGIKGKSKPFTKNTVIYGKPFNFKELEKNEIDKKQIEEIANNKIKEEIINLLNV